LFQNQVNAHIKHTASHPTYHTILRVDLQCCQPHNVEMIDTYKPEEVVAKVGKQKQIHRPARATMIGRSVTSSISKQNPVGWYVPWKDSGRNLPQSRLYIGITAPIKLRVNKNNPYLYYGNGDLTAHRQAESETATSDSELRMARLDYSRKLRVKVRAQSEHKNS